MQAAPCVTLLREPCPLKVHCLGRLVTQRGDSHGQHLSRRPVTADLAVRGRRLRMRRDGRIGPGCLLEVPIHEFVPAELPRPRCWRGEGDVCSTLPASCDRPVQFDRDLTQCLEERASRKMEGCEAGGC